DVGAKGQSFFGKLMERTKVGAYGSMRYGTSNLDDLHNTFTFRRLVLTVDSPITERLKAALELEFERFTELEVEKRLFSSSGVGLQQAVEATNHSEISLEQAWMQYDIADWFKLRAGAVLVPRGTFADDVKSGKAVATRWAYSPWLGDEVGVSLYWGRYTPDFLPNRPVFSVALDGKKSWGPFEIEGQYVHTQWSGVKDVARGFARKAVSSESEAEIGDVETEVEFELANLATSKQGYW